MAQVCDLFPQALDGLSGAKGLSPLGLVVSILLGKLSLQISDILAVLSPQRLELLDHVLGFLEASLETKFSKVVWSGVFGRHVTVLAHVCHRLLVLLASVGLHDVGPDVGDGLGC